MYLNYLHTNFFKTLTAIIIVARVQPGTSTGITDLLLPHPSSGSK